jgi:Flp pilus assembly pilin Flp
MASFLLPTGEITLLPNKTIQTGAKALQRGQGMTEYIIIVALIAVAAIAVYQFFGSTIRHQTAAIAEEVSGKSAATEIKAAQTSADAAVTDASRTKGLDNFTNEKSQGGTK